MRVVVALSAVALGQAAQFTAREKSLEATWEAELDGTDQPETKQVAKKNPIQRVIGMLKDMKAQLENEAAKEAEMYDQMVCWCETNEKEKTKAIKDGQQRDSDLVLEIQELSARSGTLATEIEALKQKIADDTESLKQARGIREGEAGEFRDTEKDLVQALNNLRNAISVLSRHHGASMLQMEAPIRATLVSVLRDVALKYDLLVGKSPLSQRLETAFI